MTGANETEEDSMAYKLTREALLLDLYAAFTCASRHKTKKSYVCRFRRDLRINLEQLADELLSHTYRPEPSSCFIVDYPKKREVFCREKFLSISTYNSNITKMYKPYFSYKHHG